ncbi:MULTISPECIES: DUF1833 family protein [Acinetobacter]|jgi:hypothetical protein|uniref:DUF1833 family protein n=1 Tax=Acinetobacter TaxID=469 RepID=UPI000A337092|nr:DUF1833 family protein [Acinetobacter sp. ANC 4204]OTG58866.1 hypothetical protein B9T36_11045 [Acinetobacter sp. ANC 4204]
MTNQLEEYLFAVEPAYLIECVEIKHSLWDTALRYVINLADGVSVGHDSSYFNYEYVPLSIDKGSTSDDLDQTLSITIGDLGEIVPGLIDQIFDSDSTERPTVTYRAYSSLDLSTPLLVIDNLEITDQSSDYQGTTFNAEAPKLNITGTGLLFTKANFPTLIGFY